MEFAGGIAAARHTMMLGCSQSAGLLAGHQKNLQRQTATIVRAAVQRPTVPPPSRVSTITAGGQQASRLATFSPGGPSNTVALDPLAYKTEYNDSLIDLFLIKLMCDRMAEQLEKHGQPVFVPLIATYDDLVRISREILRGRSPEEQTAMVLAILDTVLTPDITNFYRTVFPTQKWTAEVNAFMAAQGFFWLVGDCEWREGPVQYGEDQERVQKSIVHIKRCR